jgi:flagellar basal body-associated protein FliL
MKICPTCQTRYTDDTLQFCLQDGAALLKGDDEPTSMPTVAFNSEQETVVKKRPGEKIGFDLQNSKETQNWQPTTTGADAFPPSPKKSNVGLIVALTALMTLLVLGAGGLGAWLYFKDKTEIADDPNAKNPSPANSLTNKNANAAPNASPDKTPTVRPTPEKTPLPDFDPEELKRRVMKTVFAWKSAAESTDITEHLNYYADRVDYYNKKGTSRETVRADKQRAFSIYDTITFDLTNMSVMLNDAGDEATVVFDKEWFFESDEKTSEGKVQSELRLKRIDGEWKITSERDLKVYYVK